MFATYIAYFWCKLSCIDMYKKNTKAHIPLRTAFALGTQRRKKRDKQHEMYMANAKILRWGPTATYIPLEMGFALGRKSTHKKKYGQRKKLASPNARDTNMLVFFALGNAKVLSFALGDAKLPNANGFASQLNIGLTQYFTHQPKYKGSLSPTLGAICCRFL